MVAPVMSAMSAREIYLAAIGFASPEHVPLGCETVGWSFQIAGNFRKADWTGDPDRLAFTEELQDALASVNRGEHVVFGSLTYLPFEPVQARANDLGAVKCAATGRMALQGGGYVCAPDQTLPGVPPEKVEAL
jgi:hypothetical protein